MTRKTVRAMLGAVALTAALAVAAPASAGQEWRPCGADAGVTGSTEGNGQGTFLAGASIAHCGTLGVRAQYSSVAGALWTSWKYSGWAGDAVWHNVGNSALKSTHSTTQPSQTFTSFR